MRFGFICFVLFWSDPPFAHTSLPLSFHVSLPSHLFFSFARTSVRPLVRWPRFFTMRSGSPAVPVHLASPPSQSHTLLGLVWSSFHVFSACPSCAHMCHMCTCISFLPSVRPSFLPPDPSSLRKFCPSRGVPLLCRGARPPAMNLVQRS